MYLLLLLGLLSCSAIPISEKKITGKVIGIKDGDNIDILHKRKKLTIRLAHIDCPEKSQPFGKTAKKFVSDKCFGKQITIFHFNKYDRNKRLIGEVITASAENLNKELVKAGLAWHYKQYSTSSAYANLEKEARNRKKGLWGQKNPIEPWNWRRN